VILKFFAPAQRSLGLHWSRFDDAILPPILELRAQLPAVEENKILVYLALDDIDTIVNWLRCVDDVAFYVYCNTKQSVDEGNIHLRPFSRQGFQQDLLACSGVITNAGFELLGEAMHYGKKLLVRPLNGQMEQQCNARALQELGYGKVVQGYDASELRTWLSTQQSAPRPFPNTAKAIAHWLKTGMTQNEALLAEWVWSGQADIQPAAISE